MVMKKIINWFKANRDSIIRNSFLLPILLVVIMSISHVVSWYDLGNPMSWAIYLSIAIEIFALASVAAASIDIKKGSIWFLFGLVTFIQIVGNIFFEYQDIKITDPSFLSWVELIQPAFTDWDIIDHRRLLATIQGGTLPIMSLTALHFFIKFTEKKIQKEKEHVIIPPVIEPEELFDEMPTVNEPTEEFVEQKNMLKEKIEEAQNEIEPLDEDAFLNEELPEKEVSVMESSGDSNLSNTLDTLDDMDKTEEVVPKPLNDTESEDKGDDEETFGPPQINNGQI